MLKSHRSRLRRLEESRIGDCPVCHGKGKHVVSYDDDPVPDGCPSCGKRYHLRIRFVDEKIEPLKDRRW